MLEQGKGKIAPCLVRLKTGPNSDPGLLPAGAAYSNLPKTLVELKVQLHVFILRERELLNLITNQKRFTQGQVAVFKGCSLSKVKLDIKHGKLQTLSTGWVSKADLINYLQCDPISDLTRSICDSERALRNITDELERLLTDRPIDLQK